MHSKKLTDSAKGETCIRCGGGQTGDVCARHYNGNRQLALGKGWAYKVTDLASADLCSACDRLFTEGDCSQHDGNHIARSEEFLFLCMMTNVRRAERDVLKV